MNPKDRILNTFKGDMVDRCPCMCPGGMMNMITTELIEEASAKRSDFDFAKAHIDPELMAYIAYESYKEGCFDNVGVPFCMTIEAEMLGATVDLGSNDMEPRVTKYPLNALDEYENIPKCDHNKGRSKVVLDAIKLLRKMDEEVIIVGNLTGAVSVASSIIDPNIYYRGLRKNNELSHGLMTRVTDELIALGIAMVNAGADVIAISDPSGTGEIMGPKYFKEFTVHYLNKVIDGIREKTRKDIPVIVHICGDMRPVLEYTGEIKSSAISFDAMVPIRDTITYNPDKLVFGNVSTYAIEGGTPEKVKNITNLCIKNGSKAIMPACGMGMGSPLINVKAMKQAINEIKGVYNDNNG